MALIWGNREQVYFCEEDWTGQITLIGLRKFGRADSSILLNDGPLKIELGLNSLDARPGAGFVGIAAGRSGHTDCADQRPS
jgi:hypothetical protein